MDESLLLSGGKDNNICIWNPMLGLSHDSFIAVAPGITNQWINEVEWCPWEPSLFAVGSFDGNTTIYNLTKKNSIVQTNSNVMDSFGMDVSTAPALNLIQSPILSTPPNWFKVPCGVSWGFGGKLITYGNQNVEQSRSIKISQVVLDKEFLARAEKLESALANDNLIDYCCYKIGEHVNDENIRLAWQLVAAKLMLDENQFGEKALKLLGYGSRDNSPERVANQLNNFSLNERTTSIDSGDSVINGNSDFVDNLNNFALYDLHIDTSGNSLGSLINKCILNKDIKLAIQTCVERNCWTEALLLCCFVGPEHTADTICQYFRSCYMNNQEHWSSLLWCLVTVQTVNDESVSFIFNKFISSIDLKYWREALGFALRECNQEAFKNSVRIRKQFIDDLASRLLSQYM